MAEVVCVDGSVLTLLPVPVLDRSGAAYEMTLRLLRDGAPFGGVGECSGWRLSRTAEQLRALQQDRGPGAFPPAAYDAVLDEGLVADGDRVVLRRLLPRDCELLCLRARDPDDGDSSGELRLWVREDRSWNVGRDGVRGRWSSQARAVLDAWGSHGTGVRALLDGPALLRLLDDLVEEAALGSDPDLLQAGPGAAEHPV
ncbi:MAG: hypothetical protein M3P31_02700 [Actinomycetota bacterium]|nr:hypothetical protein [Actinomycetota bacterium]